MTNVTSTTAPASRPGQAHHLKGLPSTAAIAGHPIHPAITP